MEHVLQQLPKESRVLVYDDKLEVIQAVNYLRQHSPLVQAKQVAMFSKRVDYRYVEEPMSAFEMPLHEAFPSLPTIKRENQSQHVVVISSALLHIYEEEIEKAKEAEKAEEAKEEKREEREWIAREQAFIAREQLLAVVRAADYCIVSETGDAAIDKAAERYLRQQAVRVTDTWPVSTAHVTPGERLLERLEQFAYGIGKQVLTHNQVHFRVTVLDCDPVYLQALQADYPNDPALVCLEFSPKTFLTTPLMRQTLEGLAIGVPPSAAMVPQENASDGEAARDCAADALASTTAFLLRKTPLFAVQQDSSIPSPVSPVADTPSGRLVNGVDSTVGDAVDRTAADERGERNQRDERNAWENAQAVAAVSTEQWRQEVFYAKCV